MKRILLLMLGILSMLPASADFEYEYKGQTLTYQILSESTVEVYGTLVVGTHNINGSLEIPDKVTNPYNNKTYAVTKIGNWAFRWNYGLTSVIIPNSVQSIGDEAFFQCTGLTSVTIGNYVSSIGRVAFYGCTRLTSVIIPNSVRSIGNGAFADCTRLTSVIIPNFVESIGEEAFSGCTGLTSVIIPNSVVSIGNKAFTKCTGLLSVTIGNSVQSIREEAFSGCTGLTSVIIPSSVRSIGKYAFSQCSSLKRCAYPETIENPFSDGMSISYDPMSSTIEDGYIFGSGKSSIIFAPISLEGDYTIPESVTSIGDYAYYGCTGLTSVIIPSSVESIGKDAFSVCNSLKRCAYPETIENPFSYGMSISYHPRKSTIEDGFIFGSGKSSIIFAPISLEGDYTIPESVTSIGDYAFYQCTDLTSVTIGNSVISIGDYAFYQCTDLTSVTIGNSVQSIGDEAFFQCTGLTSVTIGNYVRSIGRVAFSGCSGLTSVEIPNSVTSIGGYAFSRCSGLTSVLIPDSVESIGEKAFFQCTGLLSVTIGNSVTSIGEEAFSGCTGLTSVIIPSSVRSIGKYAFSQCSSLKRCAYPETIIAPFLYGKAISYDPMSSTIEDGFIFGSGKSSIIFAPISLEGDYTIPESVTSIGDYAFYLCTGLTSVTIGNSVRSIGNKAFTKCTGLLSVTIGNSVQSIGEEAFSGCTGLTSVNLGSGIKSIGKFAFLNCKGLTEIVLPPALRIIYNGTFDGCDNLSKIMMGAEVQNIDENAFRGCKATDIYITAQTPPTAPKTAFSSYNGKLWLQDPGDGSVIKAYSDAPSCWDYFDSCAMINAETIEVSKPESVPDGATTIQLSATVMPQNVTLPQIFWSSSDPEVAIVDCDGLVTFQSPKNPVTKAAEGRTCNIIAKTLYADSPIATITLTTNQTTSIEIIKSDDEKGASEIDFNAPYNVYTIGGLLIGKPVDNLDPGIYIIRQGSKISKIAVK